MSSTRGSWNGASGGNWWGLVQKKGPWNETPDDRKRAVDRGGYPHAGHVNWYSRSTPSSGVQTVLPKSSEFLPEKDKDTVVVEDNNYPQTRSMNRQSTVPNRATFQRDRAPLIANRSVRENAPLAFNVYGMNDIFYHDSRDQQKSTPQGIISPKMSKRMSGDTEMSFHTSHESTVSSPFVAAYSHPLVQSPVDNKAQMMQINTEGVNVYGNGGVSASMHAPSPGDHYGAGSPSSGSSFGYPSISSDNSSPLFDTDATRSFTMPTTSPIEKSNVGRRKTDIDNEESEQTNLSERTSIGPRRSERLKKK